MPPLPEPFPGLVIRYSYLWQKDDLAGREEGLKDRPCAIVLSTRTRGEDMIVTVAAITHTPPTNTAMAVEIPPRIKQHLNLDSERSWIVCNEVNRFIWPGPDLRRIPGSENSYSYGVLPRMLFKRVQQTLLLSLAAIVSRTS
jgi:mRNA-degrading endonuclease toxin of MazEF toxin-antitoxin module